MRRLSRSPLASSSPAASPMQCLRCLRRQRLALLQQLPVHEQRRHSAFLPTHLHGRDRAPAPASPTDTAAKRRLSQAATAIDFSSGPSLNELMHWQQPAVPTPPPIPGIAHDVLDELFPRSSLWRPLEQPLLAPTMNSADPHGIHKYLVDSPVPKSTVELLAMLNLLIGKEDLARAAMIVSTLKRQVDPKTPLATVVYNKYLEGIISCAIHNSAGIDQAERWFDDMESNGVRHDRTTFALMLRAAFSLSSMSSGNRAAKRYFTLWKQRGGDVGDLLCDFQYPQEEILRSLTLNKMMLEDVDDGYRTVLNIVMRTTKQTQMLLPESQPSRSRIIPSVRQTMSKSPNLQFMRQSLECLYGEDKSEQVDQLADGMDISESKALAINSHDMAQQRALEFGAYQSAIEVWKHEMSEALKRGDVYTSRLGVRNLVWDWLEQMKVHLKAAIDNLRPKDVSMTGSPVRVALDKQMDAQRLDVAWLTALPLETMCAITIMEVLRVFMTEFQTPALKASTLCSTIGRCVEKEIAAQDMLRKENRGLLPKQFNLRQITAKKRLIKTYASKFHAQLISGSEGTSAWPYEWNSEVRVRAAAVLLSSLLETAHIEMAHKDEDGTEQRQIAPAFYFTYAYQKGRRIGVVKANRYLSERLANNPTVGQGIISKQTPMLVRPKPWTSWNEGGYWYTREEVMRTRDSYEQRMYLKEASERNQMDTVFKGLDILGETCWTINRPVFETVLAVWNSGESLADIPPQASQLQYPPEPANVKWDVEARMQWIQACKQASRLMQNAHSQRCDINYKVDIARAFLGKRLYFPHSLDFRGRAYPIPPHFNHLGNDLCRGLLMFYEGKPLGQRGLRWLKIHLANVYGLDKMKLDEREQFAENNLESVFDSADSPLEGKRWWLNAEDPWQCLSTCVELAAALRSEDPTAYVCRLPIHQDGSCNGLQHYAALGGDLDGAKQVNLEPSDRPQDVYAGVAALVAADLERQALEGNEVATALRGKITRKVVKQSVMTNVYGVTFIGAKAQIYRALADKGDVHESLLKPASDIITRSTFKALKDMFSGAHGIQEWLKECAKRISKSLGPSDFRNGKPKKTLPYLSPVIWTSPLGLPVCQPYRKNDTNSVNTVMCNITLTRPDVLGPVDGRKQATAFPPNYIHSLDASHMLLSAIACNRAGLTFASVHDSFWTHACDVDTMNTVLREAFIRMHESDLITQLHTEFTERYKGYYMYVPSTSARKDQDVDEKGNAVKWVPLTFPAIPKKATLLASRVFAVLTSRDPLMFDD